MNNMNFSIELKSLESTRKKLQDKHNTNPHKILHDNIVVIENIIKELTRFSTT